MLTFEWDGNEERLEIHSDEKGLDELISQLTKLRNCYGSDHIHLMTGDWGGSELSANKQNNCAELIHHVKIFKWGDS